MSIPNDEPSQVKEKAQESKKSHQEILAEEISTGLEQLERPALGLFLSALAAGLEIGFGPFLMGVAITSLEPSVPEIVRLFLVAGLYAVGFIFVVLGRSELFTEHTALAVIPVLGRHATVRSLGRLWLLVLAGNLLGGLLFARLGSFIGPALGVVEAEAFQELGHTLVKHPGGVIFWSAVLAGWLMGLLSWLVAASRDTISQILLVGIITFAIGLARFHHVVAGSVEVLLGYFAGGVTGLDFFRFLGWTVMGNVVGGVFFVALLKYLHVRRVFPEPRVTGR